MLRSLILTSLLLTTTAMAQTSSDDCLRYMMNRDRAQFIWKKQCSAIVESLGKREVISAQACFSKLENQFKDRISYALVVDLEYKNRKNRIKDDLVIFNTTRNITETPDNIIINYQAMSPELVYLRSSIDLQYDKTAEALQLKVKRGRIKIKEFYDFTLECKEAN